MRRLITLAASAALLAAGLGPTPATATPEKFEMHLIALFPDFQNNLVVFVNTTREDVCTEAMTAFEYELAEWFDDGMVGDPPDEVEGPEGIDPVPVQEVTVRSGAVIVKGDATDVHFELWELDAPEDQTNVGPCTDSDDAMTFVAAGPGTWRVRDNDLDVSETRGNAFGDYGSAIVEDSAGQLYRYTARFHLNDRCYAPDDGPPACLVEWSRLRPL